MRAEAIRDWQRAAPFVPFRISLSDGHTHEVRHRNLIPVTTQAVFIALPSGNGDDLPDEFAWVDPIHITRIEPMRQRHRTRHVNGKK